MDTADYEVAYRAAFDQRLKAIDQLREAWPYNAQLSEDDRLREACEEILAQPSAQQLIGVLRGTPTVPLGPESGALAEHCAVLASGFLLWDAVAVVLETPTTTAQIENMARATKPSITFARCDRCSTESRSAVVLVPYLPTLIAIQLCAHCSADLAVNAPPVHFTLPTEDEE